MNLKARLIAILGIALICLYHGLAQVSKAQEKAKEKEDNEKGGVIIRKEEGPAGHSTIGIDEKSTLDIGKEYHLTFSTLMTWNYDINGNTPPPDILKALHGQKVRLTGFMYPLQEGKSIQYFCLLRTTQTCCYGPRPQYNQYVFVEMEKPTTFYRLDPVTCVGKFYVEPTPDEGFIFRMEGRTCKSIK
jgi:hypothetical protein